MNKTSPSGKTRAFPRYCFPLHRPLKFHRRKTVSSTVIRCETCHPSFLPLSLSLCCPFAVFSRNATRTHGAKTLCNERAVKPVDRSCSYSRFNGNSGTRNGRLSIVQDYAIRRRSDPLFSYFFPPPSVHRGRLACPLRLMTAVSGNGTCLY